MQFINNKDLTISLVNLYNLTNKLKNKKDKKGKQDLENPDRKLKDIDTIIVPQLIYKDKFNYNESINDEDLYHLLLNLPIILTVKYNYSSEDNQYIY